MISFTMYAMHVLVEMVTFISSSLQKVTKTAFVTSKCWRIVLIALLEYLAHPLSCCGTIIKVSEKHPDYKMVLLGKHMCDWIYGNRFKLHIGSYEIIDFKDFNTL